MGTTFNSKTNSLFSKIQNNHDNPIYSKIDIEDISSKNRHYKTVTNSNKRIKTSRVLLQR